MNLKYLLVLLWVFLALLDIPLVDAKKKKGKSIKKKAKKTKEQPESDEKQPAGKDLIFSSFVEDEIIKEKVHDEGESTIQELDNIAVLHSYIKQDQFVLLFVHHEESEESEEALEEFRKTEKKLRGYAHFLLIDCDREQFQNEVTPMWQNDPDSGIFPLISGFVPPSTRFNPYKNEVEQNQEIPFGDRRKTEKGMSKFVTANLPNFVSPISKSKEYDSKLESKKAINKVVLFSEKSTSPVLFKALATKFKDRIDFFFADSTKLRKKTKELKITSSPTIMVYSDVSEDGEKLAEPQVITYEGNNNILELIEFLAPFALSEPFDPKSSEKPQYQRRGKYTFVNHKNYTRGFMEDYRAQVVFFEKDFKNIQEKFEVVASVLHGPINVVFFNCESPQSQRIAEEKFGVKKFPKLLVFSTGSDKNEDTALDISMNTAEDEIINIVEGTEIKDNLREVSESVLSSLIVNNALQLNKITLVYLYEGDEDEVPLSFRSISTNPIFEDNFEFIAMKDPGAMTIQQFQVPKLPVIIGGIPPPEGQEGSDPEGQSSLRTMVYQGEINDYFELLDYNLGALQTFFPDSQKEKKTTERSAEASVDFQEVTYDNFDDICESMRGLWVIGFLNGLVDTPETKAVHQDQLRILEDRNLDSSSQFKYMWINASCHQYLLPEFELSDMFIPTVVIYSPSQGKYSRMVTTFTKPNLGEFEKSFEGTGVGRIIVYDTPGNIGEKLKDLHCPSVIAELQNLDEENMLDKEMEDEIMREILEEEKRKEKELKKELQGSESEGKKKKKSKKGKKGKKGKKKKN